eukprot:COSAG02_NODE_2075_length_9928_cov_9.770272_5_plen_149_part_00
MDACEASKLVADASRVDMIHSGFGGVCRGIAGFASELRNHLIVEHAAQLLKDQFEHCPSALPLQPTAGKKPTALLSNSVAVPQTATRSRGSRHARQPRRADSAPRSEPTPEGSLWNEEDESKLQVSARTRMIVHNTTRHRRVECFVSL